MADSLATLSSAGFVDDPGTLADRLFSYSQISHWSQSYIYRGGVYSLPHILKEYMTDPYGLSKALEELYKGLFSGFFEQVFVLVNVNPDVENINKQNIEMKMKLVRGGVTYDFAKLLLSEDGKLKEVTELAIT